MPKTTRIIVLILSLSVFCPFACGTFFDPILLTDSSLRYVVGNQPISSGKAPESLGAFKPLSRPSKQSQIGDGMNGVISAFKWDPFNPPSDSKIEEARYKATSQCIDWYLKNDKSGNLKKTTQTNSNTGNTNLYNNLQNEVTRRRLVSAKPNNTNKTDGKIAAYLLKDIQDKCKNNISTSSSQQENIYE